MFNDSLIKVRNRLATDGEELIVVRFEAGRMGLASACDLRQKQELAISGRRRLWSAMMEFLFPEELRIPSILVPPGARLLVGDIPLRRQIEWRVCGETQAAIAIMIPLDNASFGDAIGFSNGTVVLLGRFVEGQRVRVLASSSEEAHVSTPEFGVSV